MLSLFLWSLTRQPLFCFAKTNNAILNKLKVEEEKVKYIDGEGRKIELIRERRVGEEEKEEEYYRFEESLVKGGGGEEGEGGKKYILKEISNGTKEHSIKIKHNKKEEIEEIEGTVGRQYKIERNERGLIEEVRWTIVNRVDTKIRLKIKKGKLHFIRRKKIIIRMRPAFIIKTFNILK